MNNDLISRSELKKAIDNLQYTDDFCQKHQIDNSISLYMLEKIIDNAPTVETHDTVNMYCDKDTQIIVEQIRPQGEWEEPFEMNGKTYHKCNHCHISSELILIDKFCPNCGADMRGEKK